MENSINDTLKEFSIQESEQLMHPSWETTDFKDVRFGQQRLFIISEIITKKALDQFFSTMNFNSNVIRGWQHPLTEISQILESIENYKNKHGKRDYKSFLEQWETHFHTAMYIDKRSELDAYMKETYDVDTKGMPPEFINQMLGVYI
jgi:hypothetical protein